MAGLTREERPGREAARAHEELDAALLATGGATRAVAPIGSRERAARRRRLAELLAAAGLDTWISEGGATMRYLGGVDWPLSERLFALVVLAGGEHLWIAPAFEVERARALLQAAGEPAAPVLGWDEHEHPFEPLAAELRRRGAERLGVDPALRARFVRGLEQALGAGRLAVALDTLTRLRGIKDEHELELLDEASARSKHAIRAVATLLRPGLREREIGALLRDAQARLGLERCWELSLIGPSAAAPHGASGERALARGDLLLVDTGGRLEGYCSDCTRTWIFDGTPAREVERAWQAVRDAQRRAFEALRPRALCRDADRAARAAIEAAGYPAGYAAFAHRVGHGIGLEGHEDPYLDGGSLVPLDAGMAFTCEPGLYFPGAFGVRIEDVVAVTAEGARVLGGAWQAGPLAPGP